jgi:hypothetical protein
MKINAGREMNFIPFSPPNAVLGQRLTSQQITSLHPAPQIDVDSVADPVLVSPLDHEVSCVMLRCDYKS